MLVPEVGPRGPVRDDQGRSAGRVLCRWGSGRFQLSSKFPAGCTQVAQAVHGTHARYSAKTHAAWDVATSAECFWWTGSNWHLRCGVFVVGDLGHLVGDATNHDDC
jgi:hypothetical protein